MMKGKRILSAYFISYHDHIFTRYTSLGSTYNTFPNPALLLESSKLVPQSSSSFVTPATVLTSIISTTHHVVPKSPKNDTLSPTAVLSSRISSTHVHVNGNGNLSHSVEPNLWKMATSLPRPRYRPAYELLDGNLERCGRGLAVGLNGKHVINT